MTVRKHVFLRDAENILGDTTDDFLFRIFSFGANSTQMVYKGEDCYALGSVVGVLSAIALVESADIT